MQLNEFISEALERPSQALSYQVGARLEALYPDRAIVETYDCDFQLFNFVREGFCTIRPKEGVRAEATLWWDRDDGVSERPKNAWYEVDWLGHSLEVLLIDTSDGPTYHWIVADTEQVARRFFQAVCEFDPEYRDEVLVFDGGRFEASSSLFRGLEHSGFDTLVLPSRLKEELRDDLDRFFRSRPTYERLGAPWRRGLLLTGPPGNGKTHTIKALVGSLGKPCLYIKTLKSERWTEETAIRRIFQRARALAPCLVVLEDLDALVTDENRSFLLNELDGFSRNTGVVVLATTNHPEKLDTALTERPSRFDRKYHFPVPALAERANYLNAWSVRLPVVDRPSDEALAVAADRADGFSFAYLKELTLSATLASASSSANQTMDESLLGQLDALRKQLGSQGGE